ncbi:hypothetical protein I4U23_031118 [Adineta vaga]|nr:hypothetical protein I4U23_031118 [Adineta vaga]
MGNISQQERNQFTIFGFDKVDELLNEWFLRTSFDIKSELSFWEELRRNKWRRSAKIPSNYLFFSKVEYGKNLLLSIVNNI